MCYPIRARKSILMIQIDWVELSLLSNKTRLVLSSLLMILSTKDISCLMQQSLPPFLDIDTCLLEFEEKHKRSRCITWMQSREVNMLIFICLSLITDDAHTRTIEKEAERHNEMSEREKERTRRGRKREGGEIWSEWARENNVHLIPSSLVLFLLFFSFNFRLWRRHGHRSWIFIVLPHPLMDGKLKVVIIPIRTIIPPPLRCSIPRSNPYHNKVRADARWKEKKKKKKKNEALRH